MAMMRSRARIALVVLSAFMAPVVGGAMQAPAKGSPVGEAPSPLIVGVVIDEAGITPVDLQRSKELIVSTFELLPPGARMMVAALSGEKRIVLPPTADKALVSGALDAFKLGETGVALPDGLFDIVEYLTSRPAETRALLLFSAGRARDGDLHFEDPLNAASNKGLRIFAIAVGQGDGKMLRRIAKLTSGEYMRLEVADAAALAGSMKASSETGPAEAPRRDPAAAVTEAEPTPRVSSGLLGAAAIFFSLGGLLMLGIVVLLIRKMSPAPKKDTIPAAPAAMPRPDAQRVPPPPPSLELDEEGLEKTLVVNATPILRALSGPGAGKNFPLQAGGQTSIGRSRRNDIVVPEDAASAQHCRIDREGDSYVLHDLGATNGTWVNGARAERAVLQHGDRLKIGETIFTVSLFGDRA